MNPGEHERMAEVEDQHFWYRGLRDLVLSAVVAEGLPESPRVLDTGCGTGANLRAIDAALAPSYLGGFDLDEGALSIARRKAPSATLRRGDIRAPELGADEMGLDLVLSLDVVYIPGIEASEAGLVQLVDALAPGGLFVLNVPAYDWLFSEHDLAVHTFERYTRRRVGQLLRRLGLHTEILTYRLCGLFPLVLWRRVPFILAQRAFAGHVAREHARSALHSMPGPLVNEALYSAILAENRLITRGVAMPFGSSVFAIGRRP